uniref:Uncharacterized protein n=1 Tax=Leersia perrieri TaxID=77586 RepID=A0A0D9WXN8_9ORYZ
MGMKKLQHGTRVMVVQAMAIEGGSQRGCLWKAARVCIEAWRVAPLIGRMREKCLEDDKRGGGEMTGNPEADESSMNPGTVMQPNAEMSINLETGGSNSKPSIILQPNAGLKTEDQDEAERKTKTESGSEYEEAKASEIKSNQDSHAMLQPNKGTN